MTHGLETQVNFNLFIVLMYTGCTKKCSLVRREPFSLRNIFSWTPVECRVIILYAFFHFGVTYLFRLMPLLFYPSELQATTTVKTYFETNLTQICKGRDGGPKYRVAEKK